MGTRAPLWIAVVVVGLGATLWLQSGDDPAPTGPAAAAAGGEEVAVASAVPDQPAERASSVVAVDGGWWVRNLSERAEESLAPATDPIAAATLRGRLTVRQRPWLHPAKVDVRLTRSWLDSVLPAETGANDQVAPTHDDVVTTTDADGWFTLRFQPPSGELFFLIDRGGPWMDFQKVRNVPRTSDTVELGDVWIEDRGGLQGTVVDSVGSPVTGAMVRAVDDPLLDVGAGLDELRAARNRGIELFRLPGSLKSGPVPDWVVRRDKFLPFPTAVTDAAGRFQLAGLRPGTHDVVVTHDFGHQNLADVQVAIGRSTNVGRIELRFNTPVKLTFTDESKQPWVGAGVAFLHKDLGFGTQVRRTNSDGEIDDFVPTPEACVVAFAYPGGGPWLQLPYWPNRDRIQVPRPKSVTVTLQDERGAAVPHGQVRFYVVGDAFRPVDRALPTYLQPTEVSPGVHRGKWPCSVIAVGAAPGFAPAMAPLARAEELTMTMLPIRSITVRTVDRHRNTLAGASVRIQAHRNPDLTFPGAQWDLLANDRVYVGRTDEQGLLQVPVWDTLLSLQADHPAFGPSPGPKLKPVPGETIDLELRRPARVHGRLSFHQRPAPAGFRVRARQRPPVGHVLEGSGWLDEQLAVTGNDGAFAFRGLNAGIWDLQPELPQVPGVAGAHEPGSQWKKVQVMVAEDQELYCTLETEADPMAARQITGTVKLDGQTIDGALVRLRKLAAPRPAVTPRPKARKQRRPDPDEDPAGDEPLALWTNQLTTNALGDFSFGDLEPDTDYELRIDVPAQDRLQFLERRVVRTKSRTLDPAVQVEVDVATGTLQLTCTDRIGALANRMLRLRQVGPDGEELARFELLTSPLGLLVAERLPAGTWTVETVHGGVCRPAEFVIKPGQSAAGLVEILGR